jgi:hypothetical protein
MSYKPQPIRGIRIPLNNKSIEDIAKVLDLIGVKYSEVWNDGKRANFVNVSGNLDLLPDNAENTVIFNSFIKTI